MVKFIEFESSAAEALTEDPELLMKALMKDIVDTSTQTIIDNIFEYKTGELYVSVFRVLVYPFFSQMHDENRTAIENYGMLDSFRLVFNNESEEVLYNMYT